MRTRSILTYASFGALAAGAALLGTLATRKSVDSPWYARLRKPSFQPPRQAFAPVWTTLYGMIAASGARAWLAPRSPARTRALALWGVQMALNAGWSGIFFGARRPRAALAEIVALLASIGAYTNEARKIDRPAALLFAPYAAWTGFATVLNAAIVSKNPEPQLAHAPA